MEWTAPHPRRCPYPAEIEGARRKIEELDPQIANITNQINELNKIRLSLERGRQNCQSFIAPFNRMPTDILCEIAQHAVRQRISRSLLNQICGQMRDVVNGFKALWNHIYITKYYSEWDRSFCTDIICTNKQWLQVLLQRASPSPLFIRIGASALTEEMFEPLIPFSPYIDTVDMSEGNGLKSIPLIQLSAMNFSSLRSFSYSTPCPVPTGLINILDVINRSCHHQFTLGLHLRLVAFHSALAHSIVGNVSNLILSSDYNGVPYDPNDVPRLRAMPHLQSLKTYGAPCLFAASGLLSLTHLDLEARGIWAGIDIEDIPYGIQSLRLRKYNIHQRHKDSVSVCQFPDLKHIKFIQSIIKARGGCILAPRLEWLEVIDPYHYPMEFSELFGDHFIDGVLFGSHSLCQLRLQRFKITGPSVENMNSLGTCRDLGLDSCQVSDDFVIGLSSSPESADALFPILEKLHAPYSTYDESNRPLFDLLKESAMNRPSLKVTR